MKIHCIGIGGIGLSALARYYLSLGYTVSGSDASDSDVLHDLEKEGVRVYIGHDARHIEDVDMVVYSISIPDDNPELQKARTLSVPVKTYPEALGDVTRQKTTIAISGTHGKTTTTAMMYYALEACGVKSTLIVGSLLSESGTNFMKGESDYMVVEACEYKRSFLNLSPTHMVVTNIDADHLDYYRDIEDIHNAFQSLADKIPTHGTLTTHANVSLDTNARKIDADCVDVKSIELSVLGNHNKQNAALVLSLLTSLGFPEDKIREGLKKFPGTWRRMEYKGVTRNNIPIYDDYGHHPTEIRATYEALREKYPQGEYKIVMLFQPHLYSRTKALLPEFVDVLKGVDTVFILPIYRARREDTSVINEDIVVEEINKAGGHASKLESLSLIVSKIESRTDAREVIINMGAGNAFEEVNKVVFTK